MSRSPFDALVLSDLHLGSENCQAKLLTTLLEQIRAGHLPTRRLILNGDVFDSIDFRRLNKNHWKVLSLIRKLSDDLEITWVCGNHDGSAEIVSHLLGVEVRDNCILATGERRVFVLHGHIFDEFLDKHPILTWFGDWIYAFLQWIDRSHHLAKVAKRGSKTFLRCARKIQEGSMNLAARHGCDIVLCGHTHHPIVDTTGPVHYFNSGSWTELPCTFLTAADGEIELHVFDPETVVEPRVAPRPVLALGATG